MEEKKTPIYKKWWFIALVVFFGLPLVCMPFMSDQVNEGTDQSIGNIYRITGGETGEYGRKVTLNANSDMPNDKYLYKLPAGTYAITTTAKGTQISVVKDSTTMEGEIEVLDYVGEPIVLFKDDTGELTVAEDESFTVPEGDYIKFVRKN